MTDTSKNILLSDDKGVSVGVNQLFERADKILDFFLRRKRIFGKVH